MKLFCVIGLGQFGTHVALSLARQGAEVMVLDMDGAKLDGLKSQVGAAVRVDASDREALAAVGMSQVDTAVVALGEDFENSVLVTSHLKHLGVGWIVVRASNEIQGEILSLVGANKVVYPEVQMAEQTARSLLSVNIREHVRLSDELSLVELRPPASFVGKTLRALDLRKTYGVNVILVRRLVPYVDGKGETVKRAVDELPSPEAVLARSDMLLVVGSDNAIREISEVEGA